MANLWISDGTQWLGGVPHVKRTSGDVPGSAVYVRPTTSTWALAWQRDDVPPPAPIVTSSIVDGTRNTLRITVTTPDAGQKKFLRVVVKVGINKWSTSPTANDGTYYAEQLANEPWSEWFTNSLTADNTIEQGETTQKLFPAAYQANISLPLNTAINISVWVQDTSLNWSAAATRTQYTLASNQPPQGMQLFRTVVAPTSWDTWYGNRTAWLYRNDAGTDDNKKWVNDIVNPHWWNWQGTGAWITYLCFGTRLRQILNGAYQVNSVQIPLLRRYTGPGGVTNPPYDPPEASGPPSGSILRFWANKQPNVPTTGSTSDLVGPNVEVQARDFGFGEWETFTVPQAIWRNWQDGYGTAYSLSMNGQIPGRPSSQDPYDVSYALAGTWVGVTKKSKNPQGIGSGHLIVEWVGYSNPWPYATPGAVGFRPMGWPESVVW